jgi:uncharacterized protein (TIGR00725 family)
MIIKSVSVFGYSMSTETDDEYIGAYESSKLIAQSGRLVINGGGPGVMYASTKGAKDGGGKVRVVYYTPKNATSFEGKAGLDIADEEFHEDNYIDRTQRLIEMGDAFVIFNGGTGTVSEFAMAWSIAKLYFGRHKPSSIPSSQDECSPCIFRCISRFCALAVLPDWQNPEAPGA